MLRLIFHLEEANYFFHYHLLSLLISGRLLYVYEEEAGDGVININAV